MFQTKDLIKSHYFLGIDVAHQRKELVCQKENVLFWKKQVVRCNELYIYIYIYRANPSTQGVNKGEHPMNPKLSL